MDERVSLRSHLDRSASQTPHRAAVGEVIVAIAAAAVDLAALIADGPLVGITGENGGVNPDGDQQKDIDLAADAMMRRTLHTCPVSAVLSEELTVPELLDPKAPLCVAIDPLDGSANLANNISVGTIFSIRPRGNDILSTFFEPGTAQCAAGFVVYGPQTTLILALDASVDIFLMIAIGIDAMGSSGDSRQRPVGDEIGKADRSSGNRLDHSGHSGAGRRLRPCMIEMRA